LHLGDALELDFELANVLTDLGRRLKELVSRDVDGLQRLGDFSEFVSVHVARLPIAAP
jgi:hypothetical protein